MKRKEIIGRLNDVAELACNVRGSITLINPDTKKKIEIDPVIAGHLVASALTVASLILEGKWESGSVPEEFEAIVVGACKAYTERGE